MSVETATYVGNLVSSNPVGASDLLSEGDDHIRLIKASLQATFPTATKPFRFPSAVAAETTTVTVATTDQNKLIPVNAASGNITVNLPAISNSIYDGLEVLICKSDYSTNLVTIDGNSSDTINGRTTLVLTRPFQHARLRWNHAASAWFAQVDTVISAGTKAYWGSLTAPPNWVFCNGVYTIGDASAGADLSAVYTEQLFFHCYNAYSNTVCPVSGGRGVSATADYAAHKRLTMPDLRGRAIFGNPEMGGASASTVLTDAAAGVDVSIQGQAFGAEDMLILQENFPDIILATTTDGAHAHGINMYLSGSTEITSSGRRYHDGGGAAQGSPVTKNTESSGSHDHDVDLGGEDEPLVILPPGFIDNVIMSL